MKSIYIAGPFRAKDGWNLANNVRRAEEAIAELLYLDVLPVCPHTMYHHFDRTKTDQFWIDATLQLMRMCDAVLVLSGWQSSEGTQGEIKEAKRMGIRVFYSTNDLVDWVDEEAKNVDCS